MSYSMTHSLVLKQNFQSDRQNRGKQILVVIALKKKTNPHICSVPHYEVIFLTPVGVKFLAYW